MPSAPEVAELERPAPGGGDARRTCERSRSGRGLGVGASPEEVVAGAAHVEEPLVELRRALRAAGDSAEFGAQVLPGHALGYRGVGLGHVPGAQLRAGEPDPAGQGQVPVRFAVRRADGAGAGEERAASGAGAGQVRVQAGRDPGEAAAAQDQAARVRLESAQGGQFHVAK